MDVRQKQLLFMTVLLNPQLARSRFLPTSSQPLARFAFRRGVNFRNMRFTILLLILLCQSFVVFSQTAITSLRGSVTDSNGAVIPDAKVSATLLSKGESSKTQTFEAVTDYEGNFTFKSLSSGEYKLSVTANGFGSETERQVSVPQNKSVEIKIELGLGCDRLSEGSGIVTDEDKAEIVRFAFADAIGASSGLLMTEQKNKDLVVSTENIKPEWFKGVTDVKLKFLPQSQIQQKANREGDFLYVSVPYFKVKGLCVAVEVANTWAVAKDSKFVYLSGGGNRYEFRKESGKWIRKSIGGWVS